MVCDCTCKGTWVEVGGHFSGVSSLVLCEFPWSSSLCMHSPDRHPASLQSRSMVCRLCHADRNGTIQTRDVISTLYPILLPMHLPPSLGMSHTFLVKRHVAMGTVECPRPWWRDTWNYRHRGQQISGIHSRGSIKRGRKIPTKKRTLWTVYSFSSQVTSTHRNFLTILSSSWRYFCLSCSTRVRWRCTGSSSLFMVSFTLLLISSSAFFIMALRISWFCSCGTKEISFHWLCLSAIVKTECPAVFRSGLREKPQLNRYFGKKEEKARTVYNIAS